MLFDPSSPWSCDHVVSYVIRTLCLKSEAHTIITVVLQACCLQCLSSHCLKSEAHFIITMVLQACCLQCLYHTVSNLSLIQSSPWSCNPVVSHVMKALSRL